MIPLRRFILPLGVAASFLISNSAMAVSTLLDFTDNSTVSETSSGVFEGTFNGVGFTLTSSDGLVNFNESYDGSSTAHCGVGLLKCDNDGAGINNDEITSGAGVDAGQTLTLHFESSVYIHGFDFLDLYDNRAASAGREQAAIIIDSAGAILVDAIGIPGDGGYANRTITRVLANTIQFTAYPGGTLQDDSTNDYSLAAVRVSAVPIPAAAWLFGSGLIGLAGIARRRKAA